MKIKKFIIQNYRAISSPITIDVDKQPLMPIIGINECGKTTILNALFAFDSYNDPLNSGRQLQDTHNLYRNDDAPAKVSAVIELDPSDVHRALKSIQEDLEPDPTTPATKAPEEPENQDLPAAIRKYKRSASKIAPTLTLTRNLKTKLYEIEHPDCKNVELNALLGTELLRNLPHILYFDDFRDSIEPEIKIWLKPNSKESGWIPILERLFQQTDENYSVKKLRGVTDDRLRKSIVAAVNTKLNDTLIKQWQTFSLDERSALEISIDYIPPTKLADNDDGGSIKLEVIEKHPGGKRYFHIDDRSKGFYWFFNFVMKLEFNPKVVGGAGQSAIFLLDEPGSYLHASAQSKLCGKLKSLSEDNNVIYCTHSHYLLDPSVIPVNHVKIAEKATDGSIRLTPVHEFNGDLAKQSTFQPIWDALRSRPLIFDMTHKNVVVVEGIYDYYCLEMFKGTRPINVLPAVNAVSIKHNISLLVAWQLNYRALWDNDTDGRAAFEEASQFFGKKVSSERFLLLPLPTSSSKKRILQDLFDGQDIKAFKEELGLPRETRFDGVILDLYYSSRRDQILKSVSKKTSDAFDSLFSKLNFPSDTILSD